MIGRRQKDPSYVSPDELQTTLTPRENAVLALIMQGATSKAAGGVLGVSPRTVEFHRANIMQKLAAKNVADLMRIVLQDRSKAAAPAGDEPPARDVPPAHAPDEEIRDIDQEPGSDAGA
jgi:DNA-binding CsgD family transcriptional regulator